MRNPGMRTILAMALLAVTTHAQTPDARKAISHPAPVYPDAARKFSVSGVVKVQVVVATDGHIKDVKVIGGHPMLVIAVQDALKAWQFSPAATESTVNLEFSFHP
jgi:TonB family protein